MTLPLGARLAIGMVTIALLLLAPFIRALRSLDRLAASSQILRDRDFAASLHLGQIRSTIDDLRAAEIALLYVHTPAQRDTMDAILGRLRVLADSLSHFDLDTAARRVRANIAEIDTAASAQYEAALAGRASIAETISDSQVVPAIVRTERWLSVTERALRERTRDRVNRAAASAERAQRIGIGGLLAAALAATIIGIWLARSISRPVRALEEGMQRVADGDLSYRLVLPAHRRDEFGRLAASFESMVKRLAELDKLKAEFVSVASHELKTPINVITGYVSLLQEGIYGELSPGQRKVLGTIGQQAGGLARLVGQLLDVSRFRAGGGKLDLRDVPLAAFVDRLQSDFDGLAMQRDITWEVSRGEGLPVTVRWDQDRMHEVLGNLVSNAFKFTDRGGRIILRCESTDGMVTLEVTDTGVGIPPEQLHRVFEKFYQAANQERAAAKGTGLGLAISKEIVEAHGGRISVESTPGVGTTFTVTVPVIATRRRASAPEAVAT